MNVQSPSAEPLAVLTFDMYTHTQSLVPAAQYHSRACCVVALAYSRPHMQVSRVSVAQTAEGVYGGMSHTAHNEVCVCVVG